MAKLAKFKKATLRTPKLELMGSIKITGDLKTASKRIADEFRIAVKKSSKKLRKDLHKRMLFYWD